MASSLAGSRSVAHGSSYDVVKRIIDMVLATLGLIVLIPLMAVIALVVRASSPGPAFFRQRRIGLGGRPFVMLKFRTMEQDNDDSIHRDYVARLLTDEALPEGGEAGIYKLTKDPRVTGLGRWLRRTSLDEVPQLFNVLWGEMSLVGPRPVLPWEMELLDPAYHARFDVKPGISGLWQVSGRNGLPMSQAFDLDVEYVQRRSLALDFTILIKTVGAVMRVRDVR